MVFFAAALSFLDVYSSARNNAFAPQIYESNRLFRLLDGRCDIPKLILFKIGILAVCFVLAMLLYCALDAGVFAFAVFPMMAAIQIPTVLKNFKLYKKFRA